MAHIIEKEFECVKTGEFIKRLLDLIDLSSQHEAIDRTISESSNLLSKALHQPKNSEKITKVLGLLLSSAGDYIDDESKKDAIVAKVRDVVHKEFPNANIPKLVSEFSGGRANNLHELLKLQSDFFNSESKAYNDFITILEVLSETDHSKHDELL